MTGLPTIRQFQYLVALVDERHFGRAAERCFVTQSTLSAGLRELESVLGAQLIERTNRKVLPTPLGENIAAQARDIIFATETLTATAKAGAPPLAGDLRLGVIPTIGPFVLPRVLSGLREAYPELKLFLREDETKVLLDKLRHGDLEAALIALPYDVADFEVMTLGVDPLWVVAPLHHPLMKNRRANVPLDAILSADLLLLEDGHCLRDHALAACQFGATSPRNRFQANSLFTLIEMVANGLGITLLPEIALSSGLFQHTDVGWKPLSAPNRTRELALVWRRSFPRENDIAALGAYLKGRMALLRVKRR